jgi:hypothetical protein
MDFAEDLQIVERLGRDVPSPNDGRAGEEASLQELMACPFHLLEHLIRLDLFGQNAEPAGSEFPRKTDPPRRLRLKDVDLDDVRDLEESQIRRAGL